MDEENIFNEDENILQFTDEDGNKVEMELLHMLDYEGDTYAFLMPADDNDDGLVYIMKYFEDEDGDNSYFDELDDEKLADTLFELFKSEKADEFEFDE